MKIAIIDDEYEVLTQLTTYIEKASIETGIRFETTCFNEGRTFLDNYDFSYSIVLMDIEMGDENGLELAQNLRKIDSNVILMFITNMSQYAAQGYLVDAIDFIIKPVEYDSFLFRLKRAASRASMQKDILITISSGSEIYSFPSREIIYIEIQGHNMTIHSKKRNNIVRSSLRNVESQLSGAPFARCNNSFLVNLYHIRSIIDNQITLSNGDILSISRGKKVSFFKAYNRFIGGIL
jgi:DNA-binding LytR/AlgR family response regulator